MSKFPPIRCIRHFGFSIMTINNRAVSFRRFQLESTISTNHDILFFEKKQKLIHPIKVIAKISNSLAVTI